MLERLLERAPGPRSARPARGRARRRGGRCVPAGCDEPLRGRHAHRAPQRGELSVDRFAELWLGTQADLLGDSVDVDDDYGIWWSYIWHFVDAPGYVYAYAYGHLLALSVYRRYEEGEGFVVLYLDLLRAAARARPRSSARSWASTLDPGFWSAGLELVERQLDAAEAAARGRADRVSE